MHCPELPISANPTWPPFSSGRCAMSAAKFQVQIDPGVLADLTWVVFGSASGQKSLSAQQIPLGGGCFRLAGTSV